MLGTLAMPAKTPFYQKPIKATSPRMSVNACTSLGNLYDVLRVHKNASSTEIKAAYRDLAKVYHPDLSRSDGRDFIELKEAYSTLSDPTARKVYDMKLCGNSRGSGVANGNGFYRTTRRWETDQCW